MSSHIRVCADLGETGRPPSKACLYRAALRKGKEWKNAAGKPGSMKCIGGRSHVPCPRKSKTLQAARAGMHIKSSCSLLYHDFFSHTHYSHSQVSWLSLHHSSDPDTEPVQRNFDPNMAPNPYADPFNPNMFTTPYRTGEPSQPSGFKTAQPNHPLIARYVHFKTSAALLELAIILLTLGVTSSRVAKLIHWGVNRYDPRTWDDSDRKELKDYIEKAFNCTAVRCSPRSAGIRRHS